MLNRIADFLHLVANAQVTISFSFTVEQLIVTKKAYNTDFLHEK